MNPLSILSNLEADLERVEKQLSQEVSSEVDFVTQISNYLIPAGGKRIRPSFAIASACLANSEIVSEEVISAAAMVELVHLGSLYHDDVMDAAKTRRNVESVNARYGEHNAILAGDFLLARASLVAANLGSHISALLAQTIASLCEGQILEHRDIHNTERTPESYMVAIRGKTASLLSLACELGAVLSQSNTENLMREFGLAYGMAFQITDDISDLIAEGSNMGKPGGNDILEGNYTLPVIYALQEGDIGKQLKKALGQVEKQAGKQDANWESVKQARELVVASSGPSQAEVKAQEFIGTARDVLGQLSESQAKEAFSLSLDALEGYLQQLIGS